MSIFQHCICCLYIHECPYQHPPKWWHVGIIGQPGGQVDGSALQRTKIWGNLELKMISVPTTNIQKSYNHRFDVYLCCTSHHTYINIGKSFNVLLGIRNRNSKLVENNLHQEASLYHFMTPHLLTVAKGQIHRNTSLAGGFASVHAELAAS